METQLIRKTFITLIIFTWASSILKTTSSRSIPSDKTPPPSSIYDALTSHGLPMGILPKGVKNYTLDEEGRFEVFLEQACNAKFESELHYDRNVSGKLSFGQIGNLTGISAQELFLWFPVKGIRVDVPSSGLIYFDVGVVFKQFSVSLFESPPDCLAATLPPDLVTGKSIVNNLLQRGSKGGKLKDNFGPWRIGRLLEGFKKKRKRKWRWRFNKRNSRAINKMEEELGVKLFNR